MRAAAAVSPAARVFAITELCETILAFTEPADVLRCRRVAHVLLQTISHSKRLQQKLFFSADPHCERTVNPLAPAFFHQQLDGYRDSTIAARIDILDLYKNSGVENPPLWHNMLISQPPTTICMIPVGQALTIFFRRYYPDGMTFGDLERAVIAAFEIRKGRHSSRERLEALSASNSVLIYWR